MIIDFHTHIFPDKIAEKAAAGIGDFYKIPMCLDGTLSTLLKEGEKAGIDKFLVCSAATIPEQVTGINNFIAQSVADNTDKLFGFATIHPDFENIEDELDRAFGMGLKGVKIHPDFQKFDIDCEKAMRIYTHIAGKYPILVHTGDFRYEYSKPQKAANVLKMFPNLTMIGAHFGGWSEWDDVNVLFGFENFYVDTASSMYDLSPLRVRELIDTFGVERVMFGTDYPMWKPDDELRFLEKIPLTDEEREMILWRNAVRLLG